MKRPCKHCGHVWRHDSTHLGIKIEIKDTGVLELITCSEVNCKCVWNEPMNNLEYLEWKYEQKFAL